jgi:hypothetical protein
MRILSITAGAAGMYCGSCLRDNALAAELIRQGHDVTLLPFYTPTLTDEENVSRQQQVFFGGISVYLEQHMPWYRRTRRLLEVVVDAPEVIRAFTSGSIAVDPKQLGAMTVSTLRGVDGNQRKEIDKLIEFVSADAPPDVINIPYTLLISLAAPLKRALGRPRICFSKARRSPIGPKRSISCARRSPTSTCSSPSANTTRASCAITCGFRTRRCESPRWA